MFVYYKGQLGSHQKAMNYYKDQLYRRYGTIDAVLALSVQVLLVSPALNELPLLRSYGMAATQHHVPMHSAATQTCVFGCNGFSKCLLVN